MHTLTSNMQQTFTPGFMKDNFTDEDSIVLDNCSFMKLPVITLRSIIESGIPLKDKYWFVCKKLATKEQNQQIAIRVAEIVLPIYERRYPDDKRPREAIDAAKLFIMGRIPLQELRNKSYAAIDATLDAADETDDTAYAASYTASAAINAASAYYPADAAVEAIESAIKADADIKQQLLDYLLTFCE